PTSIDQAKRVSVSSPFRNACNIPESRLAIANANIMDNRTAINSKFDILCYLTVCAKSSAGNHTQKNFDIGSRPGPISVPESQMMRSFEAVAVSTGKRNT
ncbi:MAG: hypothetical protein WBN07_06370, partial [Woeseiaceae bacterium]